jgi:hypothetical protein
VAAIAGVVVGVVGVLAGLTIWSAEQSAGVVVPVQLVVGLFLLAATLFAGVLLAGIRSIVRG